MIQSAEISLSCGQVAIVDQADYGWLSPYKWRAARSVTARENWYAVRSDGKKNPQIYMHRSIMDAGPDQTIDHRDGNGLNNTRENIRFCTPQMNSANAHRPPPASGYRGVYWKKGKWNAQGTKDGKTVNLGFFYCAIEAALTRDAFVKTLYGEFAILNFPEGPRQ